MRFFTFALLLGLLVGCKTEFKGTLSVDSAVELKSKDDSISLAKGDYNAKLKFIGKRKLKIKVAGEKLTVKFDEKFKLPRNGEFTLDKADTTLNYDLHGTITTDIERGPIRHRDEFCEITIPEVICSRRRGQCTTVYRRYPGRRFVEYRDDIISKVFKIDVADAGQTYSTFDATSRDYDRVYLYQGRCGF
ncbi:hypothetical protein [Halobacteriovorax sp. RZ-2]|uniref:hypothetical protein n=1 Tax=unclassified Halobacteriovorax TaxID=2639665 RepID=UPI0037205E0B